MKQKTIIMKVSINVYSISWNYNYSESSRMKKYIQIKICAFDKLIYRYINIKKIKRTKDILVLLVELQLILQLLIDLNLVNYPGSG